MNCNKENNKSFCNCSYTYSRKGICCECIKYHLNCSELPACYFSENAEKTYNRSIDYYISLQKKMITEVAEYALE